jgi:hypothetical protein
MTRLFPLVSRHWALRRACNPRRRRERPQSRPARGCISRPINRTIGTTATTATGIMAITSVGTTAINRLPDGSSPKRVVRRIDRRHRCLAFRKEY